MLRKLQRLTGRYRPRFGLNARKRQLPPCFAQHTALFPSKICIRDLQDSGVYPGPDANEYPEGYPKMNYFLWPCGLRPMPALLAIIDT